jgi:hypothetical protein
LPRKKIAADLRSLARGHTELCIKVLAGIVSREAIPPAARVSTAGILLDRGWAARRSPTPATMAATSASPSGRLSTPAIWIDLDLPFNGLGLARDRRA